MLESNSEMLKMLVYFVPEIQLREGLVRTLDWLDERLVEIEAAEENGGYGEEVELDPFTLLDYLAQQITLLHYHPPVTEEDWSAEGVPPAPPRVYTYTEEEIEAIVQGETARLNKEDGADE